ncbi:tyrosine-type recombinase/integrase [Lacticaseibacillus paracasei]|uniref:tyrosine-type recombinase/integrase n=1 Tax=Lacticaseibacillus paracasei TaxID=1597 RepID=UPI002915ECE6|nr:tyrosine-type recombinase/integrase [Lacticaseibacillus paracasei]WNX21727.1 tyrosine-type recombinase/integrase [Lacticaseibacillus paracasei]
MSITKTKAGTYQVSVFYPKAVRELMGVAGQTRFRETISTKQAAVAKEREINKKIKEAQKNGNARSLELKGKILFKTFYKDVFMPLYLTGSTGRAPVVPTKATVEYQRGLFKNHLLPMFGSYSMTYLNSNKEFVVDRLKEKSEHFANIKTVKAYVRQMFEVAEILDYIEYDRVGKSLRLVGQPHKDKLKKERVKKGEFLTAEQLLDWLQATKEDYERGKLSLADYTLFLLTLHLGDRKSESYALQWKHIDLEAGKLYLVQSLDGDRDAKDTKGHKQSIMTLPQDILYLLADWKAEQAKQLEAIGVEQDGEQWLFTYVTREGVRNQPLYSDYLNAGIKSVNRRHPELVYLHPHKMRHTFSTLARQGGASMEDISSALTHSNVSTTRTYVNTPDIITTVTHQRFLDRLNSARLEKQKDVQNSN